MKTLFIFAALLSSLAAGELDYYKDEFAARYKYPIYDTLFEKIVWERKVSHMVMEFRDTEYWVTLLMMEEYPHNYKGQNYPVYFAFKTLGEAAKKYEAINYFLRNNGVMAVGVDGKRIVRERVLVPPASKADPRDPILTREPLPRRLPLEKRYDSATSR